MVGDRPPCTQKIWLSMTAARLHRATGRPTSAPASARQKQMQAAVAAASQAEPFAQVVVHLMPGMLQQLTTGDQQCSNMQWYALHLPQPRASMQHAIHHSLPEVVEHVCAVPPHVD